MFYYNPDEPRLFVANKSGLSFTFNFAQPMAWAITVVTIILVAAVAIINNAHLSR